MEITSDEERMVGNEPTSLILTSQLGLPSAFCDILIGNRELVEAFTKTYQSRQRARSAIEEVKKASKVAEEFQLTSKGALQIFIEVCLRTWQQQQKLSGLVMDTATKENFIT